MHDGSSHRGRVTPHLTLTTQDAFNSQPRELDALSAASSRQCKPARQLGPCTSTEPPRQTYRPSSNDHSSEHDTPDPDPGNAAPVSLVSLADNLLLHELVEPRPLWQAQLVAQPAAIEVVVKRAQEGVVRLEDHDEDEHAVVLLARRLVLDRAACHVHDKGTRVLLKHTC
jgi:hypothetical protein